MSIKGKAYITLLDGAYSTLQKRGAQLGLVAGSWKPVGLIEEKLGDREAIKLGPKELKILENFLQNALREMMVPGAQVAIVQDGQVVWEKAFGQQLKGGKDKVTTDTLFMIGSTTKPLTTLLQARLVDQEKLEWDQALREILPNFTLADSSATRKLELRHTACACTGMPRRDLDFIFEYEGITAEERLAQLKTMSPTTEFGETFQYSNLLVAAGGYAAAHTLYPKLTYDSAYEKALREEVFGPLGFTHSRVHPFAGDRLASPHAIDMQGRMVPIPQRMDDMVYGVAPAGAVWSTARDLSRYVMFELGRPSHIFDLEKIKGGLDVRWGKAGEQLKLLQLAWQSTQQWLNYAVQSQKTDCKPCIEPLVHDTRFAHPSWQGWPFNALSQSFLLTQHWWDQATKGVRGVSPHHEAVVNFTARQCLDMLSPANFVMSNPEVLERTEKTRGGNLRQGFQNWLEDTQRWQSGQPPKGAENFVLGRDVAVTPGKVIYRNHLIELIQYTPTTGQVR